MAEVEIATLGAGCFWCVEAVFKELEGVRDAVCGYAGGALADPTYEQVCRGNTGHAEVVQVRFDPGVISFADLLEVFWATHDPTTLDRQGADVGPQYRSVIFCHSEAQRQTAEQSRRQAQASGHWSDPIVTRIVSFSNFYPAEEYHQDYFRLNPDQSYCRLVVAPKVRRFRKGFGALLKPAARQGKA